MGLCALIAEGCIASERRNAHSWVVRGGREVVAAFVVFIVIVHDLGGFVIDEVVGDGAASEDESRRTDVDVTLHDGLEGAVA